jgi:hypothetical protein
VGALHIGHYALVTDVDAVSAVFGAVADARRTFQPLYADLSARARAVIDARIYPAERHGATSYTVVHTSATRSDGRDVTWSVSLRAGAGLRIAAEVEVDADDGGTESLFHREEVGISATHAAQLIRDLAVEVAEQRQWFEVG